MSKFQSGDIVEYEGSKGQVFRIVYEDGDETYSIHRFNHPTGGVWPNILASKLSLVTEADNGGI